SQHTTVFPKHRSTTSVSALSLHDALPIYSRQTVHHHQHALTKRRKIFSNRRHNPRAANSHQRRLIARNDNHNTPCQPLRAEISRSEEHTSELQSRGKLVCRLLLEKKNKMS